jgi:hypothetical protein
MSTAEKPPAIPPDVMAELREAAELATKGTRDPERMRRACERMDRMRERMPEADLAVDLIRETRDEE